MQFYGRLKTIGTTQRQIKRIIYKQAIRISCIGIPIGLLLGAVVSFGIVPYFLNMMYSTNSDVGTKVSFSPFIFIGAAIFTFITVMIASMKPAKIAGNVSPIAALQYTAASTKSSARNCSKMKLSRMAWNNVFRNAKSTTLVFASLFSAFPCSLSSQGYYMLYPQLGVKLCSMAGGGVQKSIWCF